MSIEPADLVPVRVGPMSAEAYSELLHRAERDRIDLSLARQLLQGAARRAQADQLFAAASRRRDRALGREITLVAHLHMVTPCEVEPSCRYCSLSSSIPSVRSERSLLPPGTLLRAVRFAVGRGVRAIVLIGGTNLRGSDEEIRGIVRSVRRVSAIDLALDVGPSLAPETLGWLKDQGVRTIYSALETTNAREFRRAKPGDDLDARIALDAHVDRLGMALGNVLMTGLGTSVDLLRSILFLKRYPSLTYLYFSTFHPVRGTPWAQRRPGSLRLSLRALAIARLVLPAVHLGLAEVEVEDPGSAARLAAQLAAGAGNTFAALLVYPHRTIDNVDAIRREALAAGFTLAGESPPASPPARSGPALPATG